MRVLSVCHVIILQVVTSFSPANGQPIASVVTGNLTDYESCVGAAEEAWQAWADVPAPHRGEIVRQIGHELRYIKEGGSH